VTADLFTMIWKELKEILRQSSGRRGMPMGLVTLALVGVIVPLQAGAKFLNLGQLMIVVILPMALVSALIGDSFAGERERHTLETLLASPLSDRAILFGKLAAVVGYGWGIGMLSLLVGVVTVNLRYGQGKILLFSASTGVTIVLGSLLTSSMMACAGVLVSLRASTVRQAQQVLSLGFVILVIGGTFALRSLPKEWLAWLGQKTASASELALSLALAGILLLIDLSILAVAMARFQRSRLILD
jgi:ABC-2 type transport system permease protein